MSCRTHGEAEGGADRQSTAPGRLCSLLATAGASVLLLLGLALPEAHAHAFDPGLLILSEGQPGTWSVRWREPPSAVQEGLLLIPVFPESCTSRRTPQSWQIDCGTGGFPGTISVAGIEQAEVEVILRFRPSEGLERTAILAPDGGPWQPETVGLAGRTRERASGLGNWIVLGIEHFAFGWDHIAFVLGLVLLIARLGTLVAAITAFTVAHSITLAGSVLGGLQLPGPPVEAVIALSVVLLARELVVGTESGLVRRAPWAVAVGFGLGHGFGFAGALSDLGRTEQGAPWALLGFNLGLECGQLAFVALVCLPARWWREGRLPIRPLLPYAMGSAATVWTLERVSAFWGGGG